VGAVSESEATDCPFCESGETERVGQWGGQMITAQWRCRDCGSYFEAIRSEFDDDQAAERFAAPVSPSSERK
jgi:ribosomal protein L37AE/L43A